MTSDGCLPGPGAWIDGVRTERIVSPSNPRRGRAKRGKNFTYFIITLSHARMRTKSQGQPSTALDVRYLLPRTDVDVLRRIFTEHGECLQVGACSQQNR